ncbi:MAG: squalene synthase HpnC, partial [Rhodocyclaceae bacterium]
MSVDHYENFPVASVLLPPALRAPVAAIYWFARTADDFSDEGDLPPAQRLALLNDYQAELDGLEQGIPSGNPIFQHLAPVVSQYKLPVQLLRDLLDAFAQDVTQDRYTDY